MDKKISNRNEELQDEILKFVKAFLAEGQGISDSRVLDIADDCEVSELKNIGVPQDGRPVEAVVREMMGSVYSHRALLNHPRFFGFIPSPVSAISWLGDIMTSAYNPNAGVWMVSSGASCIESETIDWLCQQAGYSKGSGGLFVSGGSMSNITALVAARDTVLKEEARSLGVAYISDQTHASVAKGLRIIGFSSKRIRKIPTDSLFRMDVQQLKVAIEADIADGLVPFTVIATAGTTNTGSIDPLEEISEICREYKLWMHVDGAYGASALISHRHKHLLKGIELADSISWDAHKWLFQTYGCSSVLVKDKMSLMNSYHTNPEYLRDLEIEDRKVNYWDMGMELSRPARGLKLWMTLQIMGSDAMGEAVEHGFQLAEWAEDELKQLSDWKIVSPAQLAIVNFRFSPEGIDERQKDELNHKISKAIIEDGYAGVFTTELNGRAVLRICSIHPDATESDMRETVRRLDIYAREFLAGYSHATRST